MHGPGSESKKMHFPCLLTFLSREDQDIFHKTEMIVASV